MERRRVVFRPIANDDLDSLRRYLTEEAGLAVAEDYLDRLEAACLELGTLADRGAPRDDLRPGLRMLVVERRILILYRVATREVRIVRILHGSRDLVRAVRAEDNGNK